MNSESCENILKEIRDEMKEMNGSLKKMKEGVGKIQNIVDSSEHYNFLTADTLQKMMRGFQTDWGAAPVIELYQAAMNKIVPGIPSFPDVPTTSSSLDNNSTNESSASGLTGYNGANTVPIGLMSTPLNPGRLSKEDEIFISTDSSFGSKGQYVYNKNFEIFPDSSVSSERLAEEQNIPQDENYLSPSSNSKGTQEDHQDGSTNQGGSN